MSTALTRFLAAAVCASALASPARAEGVLDMATSAASATADMASSAASATAGMASSAASSTASMASSAASATADMAVSAASATAGAAYSLVPDTSSLPSLTEVVSSGFTEFTDQVGAAMPVLGELGYEVSTFRVQWSLPPKAKLRLRSSAAPKTDEEIAAIAAKVGDGIISGAIVSSAAAALGIQRTMGFEVAVLDIDFSVTPKVRMSFTQGKSDAVAHDTRMDDMDLMCGAAFAPN